LAPAYRLPAGRQGRQAWFLVLGSFLSPPAHPIHKNIIFIVAIAKDYQKSKLLVLYWKNAEEGFISKKQLAGEREKQQRSWFSRYPKWD
jgi:hypothetical protein